MPFSDTYSQATQHGLPTQSAKTLFARFNQSGKRGHAHIIVPCLLLSTREFALRKASVFQFSCEFKRDHSRACNEAAVLGFPVERHPSLIRTPAQIEQSADVTIRSGPAERHSVSQTARSLAQRAGVRPHGHRIVWNPSWAIKPSSALGQNHVPAAARFRCKIPVVLLR